MALSATIVLVAFFRLLRKSQRTMAAYNDACGVLAKGDDRRATELLQEVLGSAGSNAVLIAAADTALGTAYVRLGEINVAMRHLADAAFTRVPAPLESAISAPPAYALAACFALTGDLDAAKSWLAKGDSYGVPPIPMDGLPRTLIWLRSSEASQASEYFKAKWDELELALPGASMREARLLRSFADTQTSRATMEEVLRDLRDIKPEGLEYLWKTWPDLSRFVGDLVGAGWGQTVASPVTDK